MHIFHTPVTFTHPDPLADGLGDDIKAEQAEPEHFDLFDQLDGRLAKKWDAILVESRNEPADPDFTPSYDDLY